MADARLMVHGANADGRPHSAWAEWDSNRRRWEVLSSGTKILGYVYPVSLTADGRRPKPRTRTYADVLTGIPADSIGVQTRFQATGPNNETYDEPAASVEDAMALIVGAAHSVDPEPEHVVPRNAGGRPTIGQAINWRPGDDLLAAIDERARAEGKSRADLLREIVSRALYVAVRPTRKGEIKMSQIAIAEKIGEDRTVTVERD